MTDQTNALKRSKRYNFHKVAKWGVVVCKIILVGFITYVFIAFTNECLSFPYNVGVIGIEISLAAMACFMIIRMSSYKPFRQYDASRLDVTNKEILYLLQNIDYDVQRYEEGSSYYFNGVRIYKYSTLILAGVSTIILGLDLDVQVTYFDTSYSKFSKNAALVIGAVITVISSIMAYWNVEKFWLINKTMANKLRILRDKVERYHQSTSQPTAEKLDALFAEYQETKKTLSEYWEGALSEVGSQSAEK